MNFQIKRPINCDLMTLCNLLNSCDEEDGLILRIDSVHGRGPCVILKKQVKLYTAQILLKELASGTPFISHNDYSVDPNTEPNVWIVLS